ncbi:FAD-dependent monooxygenase [Streptomyces sp.]|uniref:FAD-dependent monooxygenase n=1 Tax=Streptomyces sp. TaxID=1931 RepID=UPI002F3FA944
MDTQVIVVGAGPVGLMLAGELRLGGADVIVLERRRAPTSESRASTLHARTMEILDSRGLLDALGTPPNSVLGHFGGIPLDLTLPTRYPGQWKVAQVRTERLLQEWALALGADIRRGWELRELAQDGDAVHVTAATTEGTRRLRAAYLVGCDGEDSAARRLIGAAFPGRPARRELLRADVAGIEIPGRRFQQMERGLAIAARDPDGITRVMVHEFAGDAWACPDPPGFARLAEVWKRVTCEDISGGTPVWVNSFGDADRQLSRYRHGRILFAGDAAHQQLPVGGQALNLGLQDAVNLGWKLALTAGSDPPEGLLDSYHDERHAVGRGVLANIRAQAALLLGGPRVEPVRALVRELMNHEPVRARLAGMISGLDVRYPTGGAGHPLLGYRLPVQDLTIFPGDGEPAPARHGGQGMLLDLRPVADARADGRVRVTRARAAPGSPLSGSACVLVRPDGHIAWLGPDPDRARDALLRWFGPRTPRLSGHPAQAGQRTKSRSRTENG